VAIICASWNGAGSAGIRLDIRQNITSRLQGHEASEVAKRYTKLTGILAELDRPGLKHLYRLDGGRQPESMDDEKPSDLACFRAIADSIAARRPVGLNSCAETANTHWSHWTGVE